MARYTGPNNRIARRYKFSVLENNQEFLKGKKRITVPGQHGHGRPQKLSNYGEHLYEKQKLRYMYGLMERQMKNTFEKAKKMEGVLGLNLLIKLESRLDNVVYRMGLANTRRAARQLVNHGHILVDGKKVNIPSYEVKPGMTISVREKSQKNAHIVASLEVATVKPFVEFDKTSMSGKYIRFPERSEIAGQINEAYVVEYYNK